MKKGFTLIELLAVIIILGILLMISVISYNKIIESAKNQAYVVDANAYINAAKYKMILDEKDNKLYNLSDLEIENVSNNTYFGFVLIADNDNDGKNESYIYMTDKNNKGFGKFNETYPILVNASLISENSINENTNYDKFSKGGVIGYVSLTNEKDYTHTTVRKIVDYDDNILDMDTRLLLMGDTVYMKTNEGTCWAFTVLYDDGDYITLFEKNSSTSGVKYTDLKENREKIYNKYKSEEVTIEKINLLNKTDIDNISNISLSESHNSEKLKGFLSSNYYYWLSDPNKGCNYIELGVNINKCPYYDLENEKEDSLGVETDNYNGKPLLATNVLTLDMPSAIYENSECNKRIERRDMDE